MSYVMWFSLLSLLYNINANLIQQLPADASPTEEVKHVDAALENVQEAEA